MSKASPRSRSIVAAAIVAMVFGAATILTGGTALFAGTAIRAAFGNVVLFVLWFNFIAGFGYVLAGIGLLRSKRWAALLAVLIAVASALVLVALGIRIATGGDHEIRTVGAMVLRTGVWIVIALIACRTLGCRRPPAIGT